MKVSIVQARLIWENREMNLKHFSQLIDKIGKTDLIVLPEMFTTGFTMNPEQHAEHKGTQTLQWMKRIAKAKNCCICGSVSVEEKGKYYNRLFYVHADGSYQSYDKHHLFRLAKEDEHYTAGKKKLILNQKNWKICPLICYDLRFPVFSRNRFEKKKKEGGASWTYDVLIYVANWPKVRNLPWKQLLIARAIENQCYVIGVNRVGKDGNGIAHSGDSMIIDPKGNILHKAVAGRQEVITLELDKKALDEFRKAFPVGMDADAFRLI